MLTHDEKRRAGALSREARELQDELRPLLGRERRGELDFTEEQRAAYCRQRLHQIRVEAQELARLRLDRRREQAAEAGREREAKEAEAQAWRSRTERENALINRIVDARRARSFEVGLGGVSAGGQPRGSTGVVGLARKVEEEIALGYDREAREVFGYEAKFVRNLSDDHEFGVHLDHSTGKIEAGPPLQTHIPTVESPMVQPHRDWSGPPVPRTES